MTARAGSSGLVAGLILSLMLVFGVAGDSFAAPKFPPLTGRVVDNAHLLSAEVQRKLTEDLAGLEQSTGRQVVVATVPDLQGYPIEDFGYQLGRAWGVGSKDKNDGVILLVAPNDRKVRVEVGYGLEPVLTDALSSTIVQERILPEFRAGRMEAGVVAGAQAIVRQLSLPDDQAKAIAAAPAKPQASTLRRGLFSIVPVVFLFLWFSLYLGGRRGGGLWWLPFFLFSGGRGGGGSWSSDGDGGGFSGGGGSFGGGGSSGSW